MSEYRNYLAALWLLLVIAGAARAQAPADVVWIDVRSPAEFAQGHLPEATLIPFDGIEKGVAELQLARDRPIYLYCAAGGRAEMARKRLVAQGYTQVVNVGGLEDAQALLRQKPD